MSFLKRIYLLIILIAIFLCLIFSSCSSKDILNPKTPTIITLWHNFGGQMQTTMDILVEEFNQTIGKEKGIILSVESISNSSSLQEKLTMIAAGDPGAPQMPDITTCYPQTAILLAEKGLLANLDKQFTDKELSLYLPRFIEEGRLNNGNLYVFPFAKSTEVLFVNKTLFDRFSNETGVTLESLLTFEGIALASEKYYNWTDAQTPDIANDGKLFYTSDSMFNLAQVGMQQLGTSIWDGESLDLSNKEFEQVWKFIFEPSVKGYTAIYDGYSSDLSKIGEIICSTGSTAGILFYGNEITYPDNTSENVEYTILPYPVFEGGKKIVIQRGNGMVVAASEPKKEQAAAIFLKWFTAPEQNMKFVASTGYLPVTNEAFENSMEQEIAKIENENIQKLLHTAIDVHSNYDFYIPPVFDSFNSLKSNFEASLKDLSLNAKALYYELLHDSNANEAFSKATSDSYNTFIKRLEK